MTAGIGYSVWWLNLADRIERELFAWQERQSANGVNVTWAALERGGFPYRLEIRLTEPVLEWSHSRQPLHWSAEAINAQTLAYNLDHVILDAPGAHQIRYSEHRDGTQQNTLLDIIAENFWASLVFEERGAERFALDLAKVNLNRGTVTHNMISPAGNAFAERLQVHARPTPRSQLPNAGLESGFGAYDAALRAENIHWEDMGDPLWTGSKIELFEAQTRLTGLPNDFTGGREQLASSLLVSGAKLSVSEFSLLWGPIDMTGYGELTLDDIGRPEGQFRTSVGNLPALIDALVSANIMTRQSATLAFAGLTALSNLQGEESGRVRLPVAMKDGVLFLGPVAAARLEPII